MKKTLLIFMIIFSFSASAQFGLENIDKSDLESLVSEFSGNFNHTTVSGAAGEGMLFGFQVGLAGGTYASPKLKSLAVEAGESKVSEIPHAALIGILTVPLGLTAEFSFLPGLDLEDADYNHMSLAVKWTLTDTILSLPIDLAVRGSYTDSGLEFDQTVSGVKTNTKFSTTITSLAVIIGKKLPILEPYAGIGLVSADGELSYSGSQTIFDSTLTSGNSASSKPTSTHIFAGLEADLLIAKFGVEVGQVFDNTKMTAKVAFGF